MSTTAPPPTWPRWSSSTTSASPSASRRVRRRTWRRSWRPCSPTARAEDDPRLRVRGGTAGGHLLEPGLLVEEAAADGSVVDDEQGARAGLERTLEVAEHRAHHLFGEGIEEVDHRGDRRELVA